MRTACASILLLGFLAWGGYYVLWAYEGASFSAAASPPMKELYETRAMLGLPVGIILVVLGGLLFVSIWRRKP